MQNVIVLVELSFFSRKSAKDASGGWILSLTKLKRGWDFFLTEPKMWFLKDFCIW